MIRDSKEGVATLPTILAIFIMVTAIVITITAVSLNESFMTASYHQSSLALEYAEAGARDALIRIARNNNYVCASPALPIGCYSIDFATSGCVTNNGCARITVSAGVGSGADPKIIDSQGRVGENIRHLRVSVQYDSSLNGKIATTTWQEVTN